MRRACAVLAWVRRLMANGEAERDMQREMALHLAREAELFEARGMNATDAMAAARRAFGNVPHLQEEARDAWGTRLVHETLADVRYGTRALLRTPGFTLVALASLMLGISVNTATFAFFQRAWAPPSAPNPSTLVYVQRTLTYAGWQALASTPGLFTSTGAQSTVTVAVTRPAQMALPARASLVSDGYFAMYDGRAALGRVLLDHESANASDTPGAVLSNTFWTREFGGDSAVVGRVLRLANGAMYTIVGVAREGFQGGERRAPDFWVPLATRVLLPGALARDGTPIAWTSDPDRSWLSVSGRLAPGVTVDDARLRIASVLGAMASADSAVVSSTLSLVRGGDESALPRGATAFYVVLLATLCVMLIGCANVANLVLARGAQRRREVAVRLSLGATRARLVRQLMTESVMLAVVGGAGALVLSSLTLEAVFRLPPVAASFGGDLSLFDGASRPTVAVVLFTFGAALVSAVACGLWPALRATHMGLAEAARDDGRAFGTRLARSRLRTTLVMGQVALSLVLLISASVLIRSARNGASMELGFDRDHVSALQATTNESGYTAGQHLAFGRALAERLSATFGAENVARGSIPLADIEDVWLNPTVLPRRSVAAGVVSPGYFKVMGMALERGRMFTDAEARANADVAIVSSGMARRLWPGSDPLGQQLAIAEEARVYAAGATRTEPRTRQLTVVGVVSDAQMASLDDVARSFLYLPADTGSFVVRTKNGAGAPAVELLREAARTVDPNVPVTARTMNDIVSQYTRLLGARVTALFCTYLGTLALVLSALGIFGVVAYAVSQRTRELGIRLAIGAQRSEVLAHVIRQSMRPVLVGTVVGIAGGVAATRAVRSMMFGLSSVDPLAYGTAALVVCGAGLLACYLPARRATRIDPVQALRAE